MGKLSTLASDTVVYGASTILSRLVGWLMMPLYTHIVSQSIYGTFSYIYSFIAILLVLVTLGFETGYFRYVTDANRDRLLGTLSSSILSFGLLLLLFSYAFQDLMLAAFDFDFGPNSGLYLLIMMAIVLLDSYNSIFFAELRYLRRSLEYAVLRLVQVLINVVLTVFFLFFLRHSGGFFSSVDDITYMMLANLFGSLFSTLWFVRRIAVVIPFYDFSILKKSLVYSLPLVGMGFLGQSNTNIDKILLKHLDTSANPLAQVGIYSASYKIGVLMSLFTQSFRMAFEPFFFKENKDKTDTHVYADALKYFVLFGLLIFAGVVLFLPLIYLILPNSYSEGRVIIPFVLIGQLFFGVYYSLSLWYKVTDRTYWGIIMSAVGLLVNILLDFVLIPQIGYLGAAIAAMVGYAVMMILSYAVGQRYYPIAYPIRQLILLSALTVGIVMLFDYFNANFAGSFWLLSSCAGFAFVVFLLLRLAHIDIAPIISKFRKK